MTIAGRIDPEMISSLEPVLEDLVSEHESLLALAREHRVALTQADPAALDSVVGRTGESLARIAELEDQRCRVMGLDPERMRPGSAKPTITEIAALVGPEEGARLRRIGERLKEVLGKVRSEHASVREASKSLADHMQGLMKQVAAKLSHAGTYSATGNVDPGREQVVSGIDVKS